jgi:hypothetical protein
MPFFTLQSDQFTSPDPLVCGMSSLGEDPAVARVILVFVATFLVVVCLGPYLFSALRGLVEDDTPADRGPSITVIYASPTVDAR